VGASSDEIRQIGGGGVIGDVEAITEIVPEREAELGCGAHEAEESVATVATEGHLGAAADLAPGDDCPFILPMSGRIWKSIIRGIRIFDARLLFTTLNEGRTVNLYKWRIPPAFFYSSPAGCSILSPAQR